MRKLLILALFLALTGAAFARPFFEKISGTGTAFTYTNETRRSMRFTGLDIEFSSAYSSNIIPAIVDADSNTNTLDNITVSSADAKNYAAGSAIDGKVLGPGETFLLTLGSSATVNIRLSFTND